MTVVGVVLLRVTDRAAVSGASWDGRGVEVLLQRRGPGRKCVCCDWAGPLGQYCPPCGHLDRGEKEIAHDPMRHPNDRKLALWHGALRELIEEAGGGTGPLVRAEHRMEAYEPDEAAVFKDVCLPPALLGAPSPMTHFWLGDDNAAEPEQLHQGRGSMFAHVIAEAEWATDAWRPRAQRRWRRLSDDTYARHGLVHGYKWAELKYVLEHLDGPVRGGGVGMAPFARSVFEGAGRSRLLFVIRQAAAATFTMPSAFYFLSRCLGADGGHRGPVSI